MRTICLYFEIHQIIHLKRYRFFDIGNDHYYYDDSCWSPDSHHNHGGSSGHTHYMYNKVNNNAYTPVKLSYNFGEKIETITAGDNHTVVMTESGKVYALSLIHI